MRIQIHRSLHTSEREKISPPQKKKSVKKTIMTVLSISLYTDDISQTSHSLPCLNAHICFHFTLSLVHISLINFIGNTYHRSVSWNVTSRFSRNVASRYLDVTILLNRHLVVGSHCLRRSSHRPSLYH
jgi:hypothetical protein